MRPTECKIGSGATIEVCLKWFQGANSNTKAEKIFWSQKLKKWKIWQVLKRWKVTLGLTLSIDISLPRPWIRTHEALMKSPDNLLQLLLRPPELNQIRRQSKRSMKKQKRHPESMAAGYPTANDGFASLAVRLAAGRTLRISFCQDFWSFALPILPPLKPH